MSAGHADDIVSVRYVHELLEHNYGNSAYATENAADTVATKLAFDTLIKEVEVVQQNYPFYLTITDSDTFSFMMSAAGTFYGCSKLRQNVPAGLFAGISGAPASGMFSQTFYGCTKLSGIDENVFGDLTGAAQTDMFTQMFYGDNKLYGNSPRINGKYLYEIWPNATQNQVGDAFYKCSKLSDYKSIPTTWR